jgi:uncharacterized protein YijF (DUF1287 family)
VQGTKGESKVISNSDDQKEFSDSQKQILLNLSKVHDLVNKLKKERNAIVKAIGHAESSRKHVDSEVQTLQKRMDYFEERLKKKYAKRDKLDELIRVTKSKSGLSFEQGRQKLVKELDEVKMKWAFSQKDVKIQERRLAKMNEFLGRHRKEYDRLQLEATGCDDEIKIEKFKTNLSLLHTKIIKENEEKDRIIHDLEGTKKQELELRNAIVAKKAAIAAMNEIASGASERAREKSGGHNKSS